MFKYNLLYLKKMDPNVINKYKDKGLTGLSNLGNTCFINSCLQVLVNTYEFTNFLDNQAYKSKLAGSKDKKFFHESCLLVEYDNLRQVMLKENCCISPGAFIKIIQIVFITGILDLRPKAKIMLKGNANRIPVTPKNKVTRSPPHLLVPTTSKPAPPYKRKYPINGNKKVK